MAKQENKNNSGENLEKLVEIVKILRSDKGCPWDKKQRVTDVKNYILEETYELCEAIDKKDTGDIKEEIGDLFLLLVFFSVLFEEKGSFTVSDSLEGIVNKLILRHPHVFSSEQADSAHAVLEKWIKRKSKKKKRENVFQRIPKGSPALFSLFLYSREVKGLKGLSFQEIKDNIFSSFYKYKEDNKTESLLDVIFFSAVLLSAENINPELLLAKKVREQACQTFYESSKDKKKK